MNSQVLYDACDSVRYRDPDFPLFLTTEWISQASPMRCLSHWHDDIELFTILEGTMQFHIGKQIFTVHAGDAFYINRQSMHNAVPLDNVNCRFICLTAHPRLLTDNRDVQNRLVHAFFVHTGRSALHMLHDTPAAREIKRLLTSMLEIEHSGSPASRLRLVARLHEIFAVLYEAFPPREDTAFNSRRSDAESQRSMITYITEHYAKKISLPAIAAAGHVSRTKCFQLFHAYVGLSPMEYLNRYRLEVSRRLLTRTSDSILTISSTVGFASQSYYTKQFSREYGITPKKYRDTYRFQ